MTHAEQVVLRRAARVVLVDEQDHVLMIHGFDPRTPHTSYWYTLGGGIADGEEPDHRSFICRQFVPTVSDRAGVGECAIKLPDRPKAVVGRQRNLPRGGNARELFGRSGVEPP